MVYPNPNDGHMIIEYQLIQSSDVKMILLNHDEKKLEENLVLLVARQTFESEKQVHHLRGNSF